MSKNYKKINSIVLSIFIFLVIVSPLFAIAAPQGTGSGSGETYGGGGASYGNEPNSNLIVCDGPNCTFKSLIELGIHIMNYLIIIAIPLAAISFIVAGFKLLTSGGNESALKDAKNIFTKTAIGLAILLSAWLIVKVILVTLLKDPSYSILSL